MNKLLVILIASLSAISGCSQHIQTSSGQSYLDKYEQKNVSISTEDGAKDINELVREAANIEPTLKFPAKIGIARIENGQLTAIPGSEVEYWEEGRRNIGYKFGEFVPISPLITEMAVASVDYNEYRNNTANVVNKIRLGAARQHMDAVLIYEVYSREQSDSNFLAVADLTIIGAYLLPSKAVETQGYANALLIDVIQGYPYGTAEASLQKSEMASTFGKHDKMNELSGEIKTEVAAKLVGEVEEMFKDLMLALQ